MTVRAALGGLALVFGLAAPAHAGNPWEELFGRKPRTWTEPQARFSIDLPVGWRPEEPPPHPNVSVFHRTLDSGARARVTVESRVVPPKVRLAHFANTVLDETRRATHQFQLLGRDTAQVGGVKAERFHFSYQVLGHAALVTEAVEVVLLAGERAFVLTLETPLGGRMMFWEEFEIMQKGFDARAPGNEVKVQEGGSRKKLRAGEMVNPDRVQY